MAGKKKELECDYVSELISEFERAAIDENHASNLCYEATISGVKSFADSLIELEDEGALPEKKAEVFLTMISKKARERIQARLRAKKKRRSLGGRTHTVSLSDVAYSRAKSMVRRTGLPKLTLSYLIEHALEHYDKKVFHRHLCSVEKVMPSDDGLVRMMKRNNQAIAKAEAEKEHQKKVAEFEEFNSLPEEERIEKLKGYCRRSLETGIGQQEIAYADLERRIQAVKDGIKIYPNVLCSGWMLDGIDFKYEPDLRPYYKCRDTSRK